MNQTIFFQRKVVQVLNTDMFRQDLSTSGTNAACKRLVALLQRLNITHWLYPRGGSMGLALGCNLTTLSEPPPYIADICH